jgi:hypothetical protein
MTSEPRMTRQGLRDLNYYGPKRVPATTTATTATTATSAPVAVEEPAHAHAPEVVPIADAVAAKPKDEQ